MYIHCFFAVSSTPFYDKERKNVFALIIDTDYRRRSLQLCQERAASPDSPPPCLFSLFMLAKRWQNLSNEMTQNSTSFDVIVVGGGHAGSEAALVSARLGCKTALLTFDASRIGQMSCNPAIGGLGKGQLVKEIDALFGEMGRAIDETGIQFRTLNSSKGPAVRSSRAQADRDLYRARIIKACRECENLTIIEAAGGSLLRDGSTITGITTEAGLALTAKATVLTTGTFLRGLMHTGETKTIGGRVGEKAAYSLSDSIRDLGLRMGRMKTGTPPRIRLSSIDFSKTTEQPGDTPIRPFSFRTASINRPQISCWVTATNQQTHEIIAANVERSPIFNGQIESCGPRYCPSIEDKVHRFKDKLTHNIFLEPEGFDSDIVYPNGISTSLPAEVQDAFVRSIVGLENCEILQHGYAVEYDHVDPTELELSLKPKTLQGIYMAGQINGTSGYEEAGAQGILAGINAAMHALEREPFIIGREQGYIGVMIDDLTTIGVMEPYRMFTSRAEYRLHLREDNADSRLTPLARALGLVSEPDWKAFCEKEERLEKEKIRLNKTVVKPTAETNDWLLELNSAELYDAISLDALLRRPEITYKLISEKYPTIDSLSLLESERVETEIKFEGYLRRQLQDIERTRKMEDAKIPLEFCYENLKGLSIEVKHRLNQVKPQTLGQASRISGVTPAAVSLLAIYLKRGQNGVLAESNASVKVAKL
jgi:tRNA uridine 5-carboxymethylaminomethyl modification enzyme